MALLKFGSRGSEVKSVQGSLNTALAPSPGLTVDGIFGRNTRNAVINFQRRAGIGVDGIVGPITRSKLAGSSGGMIGGGGGGPKKPRPTKTDPAYRLPVLQLGSRGRGVAKIQRRLNYKSAAGPSLVADGIFGPKTRKAVVNFQQSVNLKADGVVNPDTRIALRKAKPVPGRKKPSENPKPLAPPPGGAAPVSDRPYYSEIESVYGDPTDWSYITKITPPFPLIYGNSPVSSVSVHNKVSGSLLTALNQVLGHYGLEEIERLRISANYGGSVNKRRMRNGSQWSTHSWGVAIDLNHSENQLSWNSSRALFAKPEYKPLLDIFERNGWYNLGRHKNYDFMHFQAVKI